MTPDSNDKLSTIKSLIDQIWARNKNQHRAQPWWKSLGMLRKAIAHIMALDESDRSLRLQSNVLDAKEVRKRLEQETEIRRERDVWVDWSREVLVPRAYVGFTTLVGDSQFAVLGVALVGILADIMSVVGAPMRLESVGEEGQKKESSTGRPQAGVRTLAATSLRGTGVQTGEVVERMYEGHDDVGEVIERTKPRPGLAKKGLGSTDHQGTDTAGGRPATLIGVDTTGLSPVPDAEQGATGSADAELVDRADGNSPVGEGLGSDPAESMSSPASVARRIPLQGSDSTASLANPEQNQGITSKHEPKDLQRQKRLETKRTHKPGKAQQRQSEKDIEPATDQSAARSGPNTPSSLPAQSTSRMGAVEARRADPSRSQKEKGERHQAMNLSKTRKEKDPSRSIPKPEADEKGQQKKKEKKKSKKNAIDDMFAGFL